MNNLNFLYRVYINLFKRKVITRRYSAGYKRPRDYKILNHSVFRFYANQGIRSVLSAYRTYCRKLKPFLIGNCNRFFTCNLFFTSQITAP